MVGGGYDGGLLGDSAGDGGHGDVFVVGVGVGGVWLGYIFCIRNVYILVVSYIW